MALTFRRGTPSDAEAVARLVVDGFAGYRSFSPPGWEPPPLAAEVVLVERLLAEEDVWCQVAEADGRLVGQVTVLPASRAGVPSDEPGLAHLRTLFVVPEHWGTGLARDLHSAAVEEAAARGYEQMRLFTAAAHGRARRFYEREGWVLVGEEFHAPGPDLVLVEYRLPLPMAG